MNAQVALRSFSFFAAAAAAVTVDFMDWEYRQLSTILSDKTVA